MRTSFVFLAALAGCGAPAPTANSPDAAPRDVALRDTVAESDAAGDAAAPDAPEALCARDPRVQALTNDLERRGDTVIARRESITPAGSARAVYAWVVTLRTDAGPLPDDVQLAVTPRMPDHGHGARRRPTVRPLGGGRFEVTDLDLYMDGVWTITLRVSSGGATEQVVFGVCIG
jgi:hypothetical protein